MHYNDFNLKVLINAETDKVGTGSNMSGYPSSQDLAMFVAS